MILSSTATSGQFTTRYYICDNDWSVREINPSEGYLLDSTNYKVGAEPELYTIELNSTAVDATEQVLKGNIAIIKHTDDGSTQIEIPEVSAEFAVYLKSAGNYDNAKETERDYLVCDENGFAQTKDMPYGIYTVHQTKGWEGRELMPDFDVYIAQDGATYRYLINNANFESYIKVIKTDAEKGKTIPYAGAAFKIYNPDGSLVSMTFTYPTVTTIDTFYTNAEGYLVTPEKLPYGTGYSLVEVNAPYGYVLNSEPVHFDITQDNSTEESVVTVIAVERPNMAQKGVINISKTGEVFATVAVSDKLYQPVYAVQGLPGAVYEVTATEDIYTPDGTLRAAKGEVVNTITTNADGLAGTKELYLGKYEIKEITAPHGMVLNNEIHSVELVYAGQEISVTETATSFFNERQKVEITLVKALEQDKKFGVGMNGEIFDVIFDLYAKEDITAADGTLIPANGLIELVSMTADGHGICKTDLPFGSYYLKEVSTNAAYLPSDTEYPVVFEYAGQDTQLVKLTANDGKPIDNTLIRGTVQLTKVDKDYPDNYLSGAVFEVYADSNGNKKFDKDDMLLGTMNELSGGVYQMSDLLYGGYFVKEKTAPTGFILDENAYYFAITENGKTVTVENEAGKGFINAAQTGSLKIVKTSSDGKIEGFSFRVTGVNYDQTFKTDKNGEIVIENLRIGDYTISEVNDSTSSGYVLPADKQATTVILPFGLC